MSMTSGTATPSKFSEFRQRSISLTCRKGIFDNFGVKFMSGAKGLYLLRCVDANCGGSGERGDIFKPTMGDGG